jgi:hypothetical protein
MSSSKTVTEGFNYLRLPKSKQEFIRQLNDVNIHDMCFEDRLCLIIEAETTSRQSNRIERKIREAQFKIKARPELITYDSTRLTIKNQIQSLLTANFIALKYLNKRINRRWEVLYNNCDRGSRMRKRIYG